MSRIAVALFLSLITPSYYVYPSKGEKKDFVFNKATTIPQPFISPMNLHMAFQ
jgi:hypothetical protein